jgi:hypothetical protein
MILTKALIPVLEYLVQPEEHISSRQICSGNFLKEAAPCGNDLLLIQIKTKYEI